MELLLLLLIFLGIFAVFDALRKINNNILNQTKELKKLREDLTKGPKKDDLNSHNE
ncbi:hypothetical protein [Virgibacillus indicus]|uniref:hypothetical protein n=1 Tax=Virgibacillus indicus TaxID=2024554 RepID=UPI0013FE05E6|nr:hypothetical protein [Virgibacillus indicus]